METKEILHCKRKLCVALLAIQKLRLQGCFIISLKALEFPKINFYLNNKLEVNNRYLDV